jgi:hypothetical protein
MKVIVISIAFCASFSIATFGQTKLYASAGIVADLSWNFNELSDDDFKLIDFKFKTLNVESQTRVIGSMNFVSGVSLFNAGYNIRSRDFGSSSDLRIVYLGVPVMARWNIGNKNAFFIDGGVEPTYMLKSHLKESIIRFGEVYEVEGDITKYSNRFYVGWKIQFVMLINRFNLTMFFAGPLSGQSTLGDLEGRWGLNSEQSTYLIYGYSNFQLFGIRAGVRIL